ncbi:hypothetical protein CKQ84_18435 [Shewanella sp. WE21]|uniref:hypothetical protein n=1 Tax=Shewanella sp. WE21 TaxID=2029986 RepID=UPI000CF70B2E|nr:hypothetical protein [Shewanella sp. WE21]AVI67675.1 hypothetical protein CKQ84_18435 [Shewanella sp. WE21]
MEFRHPTAVAETNTRALNYLTENLNNPKAGCETFQQILTELGNSIEVYPKWHPILTIPLCQSGSNEALLSNLYKGIDHTILFVKGFITCPYSETAAIELVNTTNQLTGLRAYCLKSPLYSDDAYPVVIIATDVELEADGTIRSRDALAWCLQYLTEYARNAQVAETWWNMRHYILGEPHGSRSSLLVNQYTGGHMRKILEVLNDSGVYGPIKEWSLEMFSPKKRKTISETLIKAALDCGEKATSFEFELRGEICKATVRDTWNDGSEFSVQVMIGDFDLSVSGFYYPEKNLIQSSDPNGKRALAKKFL